MAEKLKVLITVKTYPLPSKKYLDLVRTAGVLEDGSFVRLYPIEYRYLPQWGKYKKYQWIEVEVETNRNDRRPESYRPTPGSTIRPLGPPIGTQNNWAERKRYVLAGGVRTMCDLQRESQLVRSLGIIRPRAVSEFVVEGADRDWKSAWDAALRQQNLFGPQPKPLEKIPYKFSYRFTCEAPDCPGHKMMIEDWEIGQLYRRMRDEHRDEEIAVEKVRQKFFSKICGPAVDTHFFVGTVLRFGSWVILGAFYPRRAE